MDNHNARNKIMAVIVCPFCDKKISDKIKHCVYCKKNITKQIDTNLDANLVTPLAATEFNYKGVAITLTISVLLGYLIIGDDIKPKDYSKSPTNLSVIKNNDPINPAVSQIKNTETREAKIRNQFSAWSGSHINVVRQVKANMKNPDSFEHVKTTYTEQGDMVLVLMTYRGKNSFNAVVTERVYAEVSLDGTILLLKDTY